MVRRRCYGVFTRPPGRKGLATVFAAKLISLTNTWQHKLYRVRGNIYGLANAPFTWSREVIRRLESLDYRQHSFDKQLFYKVIDSQVVSMILVYVDDFIGLHRSDYNIDEVHQAFKWGSLQFFEPNKAIVFKGKELTIAKGQNNRYTMKITMKKFIEGLDSGKLHRGRLQGDPALVPSEQKELRSVTGCLQWLATQSRPEIAPVVSLTTHGAAATTADLKNLYAAIDYLLNVEFFYKMSPSMSTPWSLATRMLLGEMQGDLEVRLVLW